MTAMFHVEHCSAGAFWQFQFGIVPIWIPPLQRAYFFFQNSTFFHREPFLDLPTDSFPDSAPNH